MLDKAWKTIEGKHVVNLVEEFKKVLAGVDGDREIHIGTDSQQDGKFTQYVTVLVVLNKGKGGRAFYSKEKVPRIKNLRERLLKEVWMSVDLGMQLNAHTPNETYDLTVHVDANPDVRFKSSTYVQELTGLVVSQGFKALLKPDSWTATHVADHVVKNKVIGR